jgi:hypothetical protein
MNSVFVDPKAPLTVKGFASAGDESKQDGGKGRFEVRGRSDEDLWIIVYHSGGLSSLHRLVPDAQGTFGIYKPRGVSIDGNIEGKYESGKGYAIYKK